MQTTFFVILRNVRISKVDKMKDNLDHASPQFEQIFFLPQLKLSNFFSVSTDLSWQKSESNLSSPRCPQSRQTWSPNTTLT